MTDDELLQQARELANRIATHFNGTYADEGAVQAIVAFARGIEQAAVEHKLDQLAADTCPACKDKEPLIFDDESMHWAHERPGYPVFLCQAPAVISRARAKKEQEQ